MSNPRRQRVGLQEATTGQVIDVLASPRRGQAAARRFFLRALAHGRRLAEVTADKAPVYPRILDELLPEACHVDAARENNRIGSDHSRLKARLRPMRGLKRLRSVQTVSAGHALVQDIRRGHFPSEEAALKCLYLATRALDPTGRGRTRWMIRWKPALNALAITFEGRLTPTATN